MRDVFLKFSRYFCTGGIAAIFDAMGFELFTRLEVPGTAAATASFSIAAVINFLLMSVFVFNERPAIRRFMFFLSGALIGLIVNVGVTVVALHGLHLFPLLAKIAGIGAAFFFNFLVNLRFVFYKKA
jgi:putative flippase GtrA